MIVGLGNDIVDIRRIERLLTRFGARMQEKLFTPAEIAHAPPALRPRHAYYAKRFAAKEACAKALGCGIGAQAGWREMTITNERTGKPSIAVTGAAATCLASLAAPCYAPRIDLTLSDEYPYAFAMVIISASPITS